MKYPAINKQPRRTVTIPDLAGGVNLRDGVSDILDNQLTDAKNVWYEDGVLKTRPGVIFKEDVCNNEYRANASQYFATTKNENARKNKNGQLMQLISRHDLFLTRIESGSPLYPNASCLQFAYVGNGETEELPYIIIDNGLGVQNYFVFQDKTDLYCFVCVFGGENNEYRIYKLSTDSVEWALLTDDDIYKPLAYTNCKPDGEGNNFEGVQLEGFNLIGNQFRMVYSTVNTSLLSPTKTTHLMDYVVPHCANPNVVSNLISVFKAKITYASGSIVTHTFSTKEGSEYWESAVQSDGLKMMASPIGNDKMLVSFVDSEGQFKTVSASNFLENNMEIIAPCENPNDNYEKVFNMTQSNWYGGAASGIFGGSRLFLGGNIKYSEKSLVVWSDLSNPLYFNENCYTYVGNKSQAVTGFGSQSESLVIFKERETFSTKYQQNNNISADDIINQRVVDYPANAVYFPMTQIHDSIGCDAPNSIQLCRNRLVWACSNGKIYTLCSENQYSERNIYDVSEMISRRLKTETNIKNSYACDWNGHYLLLVDSHVYVMDYNSHGYQYPYSYSKNEDANINIPWWYWDLNEVNVENAFTDGENIIVLQLDDETLKAYKFDTLKDFDKFTTDDIPIESYIKTKMFDFGSPSYRKNVDAVNIGLGNNGGAPINVSFVTDIGIEEEEITPYGAESTAYQPTYINNYRISPCIRNICRFGVRLKCNGVLAVDNLNLQYRLLGGTK